MDHSSTSPSGGTDHSRRSRLPRDRDKRLWRTGITAFKMTAGVRGLSSLLNVTRGRSRVASPTTNPQDARRNLPRVSSAYARALEGDRPTRAPLILLPHGRNDRPSSYHVRSAHARAVRAFACHDHRVVQRRAAMASRPSRASITRTILRQRSSSRRSDAAVLEPHPCRPGVAGRAKR